MAADSQNLFAVTIFGYKKPGLDEDFYHQYVNETHAGHLKELLAKNKIVSYHMVCTSPTDASYLYAGGELTSLQQHNSSKERAILRQLMPKLPAEKEDDCDCVVQIVFRNADDYLKVRQDDQYLNVVNPDHDVFADSTKTRFVTGWFHVHIANGQLV